MKRLLDLAITIPLLIIISPALVVVGFLVYRKIGMPVIFRQIRPGQHGKPYTIYKFRTMTDARDEEGRLLPDAERLTKLGIFLRKTSIDEFLELINVLKGNMSLVGPRPLLMEYLDRYTPQQARRHEVKPGITGLAQVKGRNAIEWEKKFRLDIWYVDHHSIWLDLKLIAMTIWKVVKKEGICQQGHATMEEFLGSRQ